MGCIGSRMPTYFWDGTLEMGQTKTEKVLRGIPASPGTAIGPAFVLVAADRAIPQYEIPEHEVEAELRRFREALAQVEKDLTEALSRVSREAGETHAGVFLGHLQILKDPMLVEETEDGIRKSKQNVAWVFSQQMERLAGLFDGMADPYIKERKADVLDVSQKVLDALLGRKPGRTLSRLEKPGIVIATSLAPSETAGLDPARVVAFATDGGGPSSHTAIVAAAMGIPAVVGLGTISSEVNPNDTVIVDGTQGLVIVHPSLSTLRRYERELEREKSLWRKLARLSHLPADTLDARRVQVQANIELPTEGQSVSASGADGIGLYRTEFLYMNRTSPPDEEEQYRAYAEVASSMAPLPVTIRTLDLGGDKVADSLVHEPEPNPFLGWRAIRVCLERTDLFLEQLRAVLRASVHRNVRLMLPMISSVEEVVRARQLVEEAKRQLGSRGCEFDPNMPVGIMIEVPSAALIAPDLANHADFFSIGTNDLIQYTLAIDRDNARVNYLYKPLHPAVLYLVDRTISEGRRQGRAVSVCGLMASEPLGAFLLLGLGLDEFSVATVAVGRTKRLIRSWSYAHARAVARRALGLGTAAEVESLVRESLGKALEEIAA
jgi:phosphotransferase system enzyme I (PtsI)